MKQKIKIMKQRQQSSDEEIRSYMNFDQLLEKRKMALRSSRTVNIAKWSASSLVVLCAIIWFFLTDEVERSAPAAIIPTRDSVITLKIPGTPSVDTAATGEKENTVPLSSTLSGPKTTPPAKSPKILNDNKNLSGTPESAYTQAEPLHGYGKLYEYFNSNLVYPAEALKDSIQGIQTISFIINAQGHPEKIEVVESLGELFEKESLRLIENMPKWKPATLNGRPVPSKIAIPLTFQIKKIKE